MPNWLKDAVFYEIYPQSFYDTNGDGIGDIPGIIAKLDYIKDLGCNALWINPCYDSPFKDAGYDVRDYLKIAPRYGTNEDMYRLFETAHSKGIHVLLDLVPGHTSEEHEWFKASGREARNKYSDRYIWTDFWISGIAGHPYIGGECERNGTYMLNFFKCQPALNYGFFNPTEKWQKSYKDPACVATQDALMDVMRFWLDNGCDGFRVDMADSLVKDDDKDKTGTCSIWRRIREMLDKDYPEAALVSEWSNPKQAINSAGFHMDFYLDHVENGYNTLLRDYETWGGTKEDHSFFKKDGDGDVGRFLKDYLPKYEATKKKGYISFITCNHDTPRATNTLDESELKVAYATLLTLPGVPFIYYGDEIGMRYIKDIATKEGGYTRTGTRTPMQWDDSANCGFSTAEPEQLYLPIDAEGPTVKAQAERKDSLYNAVRDVLKIRHENPSLAADASFEVIKGDKDSLFIYKRGELTIVVNTRTEARKMAVPKLNVNPMSGKPGKVEPVYTIGDVNFDGTTLTMPPQSFAIFKKA
ncbi:MAG: glycosylase [Lachnospiraceae bacterium]|nr:glycosylase [Lachnospiraceae bacterium]